MVFTRASQVYFKAVMASQHKSSQCIVCAVPFPLHTFSSMTLTLSAHLASGAASCIIWTRRACTHQPCARIRAMCVTFVAEERRRPCDFA